MENGNLFFIQLMPIGNPARTIQSWLSPLNDLTTVRDGRTYQSFGYQIFNYMRGTTSTTATSFGFTLQTQLTGYSMNATFNYSSFTRMGFGSQCFGASDSTFSSCTVFSNISIVDSSTDNFVILYNLGQRPKINYRLNSEYTSALFGCNFAACYFNLSYSIIQAPCIAFGSFAALDIILVNPNVAQSWWTNYAASGQPECMGTTSTAGANIRIYNTYSPIFKDMSSTVDKFVMLRNISCYNNDSFYNDDILSVASENYTYTYVNQMTNPILYAVYQGSTAGFSFSKNFRYGCYVYNESYFPYNNMTVMPATPVFNSTFFPMLPYPTTIHTRANGGYTLHLPSK
jgi:hypothetical protein